MRLILQLCLMALILLGVGNRAWGKVAAGQNIAVRGFAQSELFSNGGDAPPALESSGEAAAWGYDVASDVRDGPNVYAYVKQNPWTAWDPDGLAEKKQSDEENNSSSKTAKPVKSSPTSQPTNPTASARPGKPAIGVGIEVPKKGAVSGNGVLNAATDSGHTFVYVKDENGRVQAVHSFGPGEQIGPGNKSDFRDGKLSGDAEWPLHGKASTWEFNITPAQMKDANKAINDFKAKVPNYTPEQQCTSTAVDVAKKFVPNMPDGKGPVKAAVGPLNFYSGTPANPHHLNQQMTQQFGPATVVDTRVFPSVQPPPTNKK